jgi:hypothetical protein
MYRRDQQAGGDTDRLVSVVVLDLAAVGAASEATQKNRDHPRRGLEVRLVLVGPQGSQRLEPLRWCATAVKLPFLGLRRTANLRLDRRVFDGNEIPGLLVRTARRGARCKQTFFD